MACRSRITWRPCTRTGGAGPSTGSSCTDAPSRPTSSRATRGRARGRSTRTGSGCAPWGSGSRKRTWRAPPSSRGIIPRSSVGSSPGSSGTADPSGARWSRVSRPSRGGRAARGRARETWAVILAAGEGKRMRSGRPKILHLLGGQPLVRYPVALVRDAGVAGTVVVVPGGADGVRAALDDLGAHFVEQPSPRGTGDALRRARPAIPAGVTELLLLYGDVPLLGKDTLAALLARHRAGRAAATVLTFVPADPTGYGRIRRGRDGRVRAIVEERDATPAERRGRECNSGIYCFDSARLWPALEAVARPAPTNAQGEVYRSEERRVGKGAGARW